MRVSAGQFESLSSGDRVSVTSGDIKVVVFNIDGELYAIDGFCGHRGGPLEEGVVRDGVVTCPWHLLRYDVKTGERTDVHEIRQAVYPVSVEDGVIVIDVPDPAPPQSMRDRLLEAARDWEQGA